tara:strand:- start:2802 stop:4199 length:1398 start_codon:yes stop_codon:yes gene_type:complete
MKISNICCIGAGFVGGPTMSVIALHCPEVKITVVDINKDKIKQWNGNVDKLPVFEPGLSEIVSKVRNVNLFFTSDIEEAIKNAEMIFLAVNTPTKSTGEGKGYAADLKYIENAAKLIAEISTNDKIVIEKSTLPVRTAERLKEIINLNKKENINFEIISNPEFLAEGTAINDLFKSDRVLIGGENTSKGNEAVSALVDIYKKWIPIDKILTTNVWSSELSKLVSNAMLAQRISSINSISALCEETGANIDEVSKAVGMDSRIGPHFLKSSVGFGGSCFKKDILNLAYISRFYGLNEVADYWESVVDINNYQTDRFADKIMSCIKDKDSIITILGWAFKKNTNDSRESASIHISKKILENGYNLKIYDPKVSKQKIINDIIDIMNIDNTRFELLSEKIEILESPYKAIVDSSLIAVCTEWTEFIDLKWDKIYNDMQKPSWCFDGRNILDKNELEKIGFKTFFIGQS